MLFFLNIFRKIFQALASQAATWQISLGCAWGMLLGFVVIWPWSEAPSPIGLGLLFLGLCINLHLGGMLLFWGIGKLLALATIPISSAIGAGLSASALSNADNPVLFSSRLSAPNALGALFVGMALAVVTGLAMALLTRYFRAHIQPKLEERQRLVKAGKVASNPWTVRFACWFFGI